MDLKTVIATFLVCSFFHFSIASENVENGNLLHSLLSKIRINPAESRIIGGHEAKPNSIPYMVFMIFNGSSPFGDSWGGGGSLITPNFVLTAGHCGAGAKQVYGLLGNHNLFNTTEPNRKLFLATDVRVHEKYNLSALENDIAIIKLPSAVQLTPSINIVPLPKLKASAEFYVGKTGRISGWGMTNGFSSQVSPVLNYVDVKIMPLNECRKFYEGFVKVPDTNLCTSGDDLTGSCHGDSGSPLVVEGVQVGIVSFGYLHCAPGYPSSFARVDQYLDWINKQLIT